MATQREIIWRAIIRDEVSKELKRLGVNVKTETAKAGAAFGKMGKAVKKAFGTMLKFTGVVLGAQGLVSSMQMLSAAVRRGIKDAIEFSIAMAEVATISDDVANNLESFQQRVLNLSTAFGILETDAAKALYQIISAGRGAENAEEAMNLLEESVVLSIGGLATLTDTVDLLTNTLNAYDMETHEAAHANDVFFETVRLGKTTITEMSAQLGLVTPIAATLGVSLEELTSILAALTKGGIKTQIATTYMRAALAQVLNISKDAEELLGKKGLGEAFSVANIRANGFMDTLSKVREELGDDVEAMRVLFPNIRALIPILALAGNQFDDFSEILAKMATIEEREVSPALMALERNMASAGMKAKVLTNAIRQGFMDLGMGVIEGLTGPISGAGQLAQVAVDIRNAIGGLTPIVNTFVGVMLMLGQVMAGVFELVIAGLKEFGDLSLKEEARLNLSARGMKRVGDLMGQAAQSLMGGGAEAGGVIEELSNTLKENQEQFINNTLMLRNFVKEIENGALSMEDFLSQPWDAMGAEMEGALQRAFPWMERLPTDLEAAGKSVGDILEEFHTDWAFKIGGKVHPMVAYTFSAEEMSRKSVKAIAEAWGALPRELDVALEEATIVVGRALGSDMEERVRQMDPGWLLDALLLGTAGTDLEGVKSRIGRASKEVGEAYVVTLGSEIEKILLQSPMDEAVLGVLGPKLVQAMSVLAKLGGESWEQAFGDDLQEANNDLRDLISEDWKNWQKDFTLQDTPIHAAIDALGLKQDDFTKTAARTTATLGDMGREAELLTLELGGLTKGEEDFVAITQDLQRNKLAAMILSLYQTIRATEEAGEATDELTAQMGHLGKLILAAEGALGRLNRASVMPLFTDALEDLKEFVGAALEDQVKGVGDAFEDLFKVLASGAAAQEALKPARDMMDDLRLQIRFIGEANQAWEKATLLKRFDALVSADLANKISGMRGEFEGLIDELHRGESAFTGAQMVEDLQFQVDMIGKTAEEQAFLTMMREFDTVAMADQTGEIAKLRGEYAKLAGELAKSGEGAKEAKKGFTDFIDDIPDWEESIENLKVGIVEELGAGLTQAFTDIVTGAKSAGEAFRDFARMFLSAIAQMIIQMLVFTALKAAFGGGVFGGFFGGEKGAAFDNGKQTFALGGAFEHGKQIKYAQQGFVLPGPTAFQGSNSTVIGGEAGPEALMPLKRMGDGRLGVEAGGGGGNNITLTVNAIDTRSGAEFLMANSDTIAQLIVEKIATEQGMRAAIGSVPSAV